jgi:hypothetical protein
MTNHQTEHNILVPAKQTLYVEYQAFQWNQKNEYRNLEVL